MPLGKKKSAEDAPGLPVKGKITPLPKIKKPELWEFSAHPHEAERAGRHIDVRLGNPQSGIAHSFVLPKAELPDPGKMRQVIPTSDHTIGYMDFEGEITKGYGKGKVIPGRRTVAEVYHAEPSDEPGTKLRFNLYEGAAPQEYAIRKDDKGRWFIHNKTQTRERRPDIPDFKPKYKEKDINELDLTDEKKVLLPKLDGAHTIIDLQAGHAPRIFSYRVAKKAPTGLIEHTHKVPELLEKKVPKALDGTLLRAETIGLREGKAIPAQELGGILNSKVLESRKKQEAQKVTLKPFPFDVVRYKGKDVSDLSFKEKQKIIDQIRQALPHLGEIPVVNTTTKGKLKLLNEIKAGLHPLTQEGVVLVEPGKAPVEFTKSKVLPDFDVYVRDVRPAVSGKTGKAHTRAGAIGYSWTPDGPVVGTLGGFKHDEAKDMLANPDKYVGRVAKVKATKVFKKGDELGALFQPRFDGWHLDKGDIEKLGGMTREERVMYEAFADELTKIAALADLAQKAKQVATGTVRTLSGSNVDDVVQKYHQQAINMPVMNSWRESYPGNMATAEGFIADVLRGKKEVPWIEDLPKRTKGRVKLVKLLEEGTEAAKQQQKSTTRARRIAAGAVAAPLAATGVIGALKEAAEKKKNTTKEVAKAVAPAAAAGMVGTAPVVQGLRTGALSVKSDPGKQFKDVAELRKNLKAGDIIMTSSPGRGGKWKPGIAALGGDPFGYHVETVTKVPKGGAGRKLEFLHSSPGYGGAYGYASPLAEGEDIVVRRFKDPVQTKQYLKNLNEREVAEDILEDVFGSDARSTMYDKPRTGRSALKSLLPGPLAKLVGGGPVSPGATVCSSLPGMASPVCFAPGVAGEDILPHHVRRTKALETIGSYRAPRTVPQMAFERALQVAPWVVRGALGAGLGYGAYKGVQALMD